MTLISRAVANAGASGFPITGLSISEQQVQQLQLTRTVVLAGAAADTNIALAGAMVGDHIVSCIHNTTGTLVDLTSEAVILSNGQMQMTDTDTSGDELLVTWAPKPQRHETGLTGAAVDTNIAVDGILVGDVLYSLTSPKVGGGNYNYLSEASITSTGNIQLTTTVTTGRALVIVWGPAAR